MAVSGLLRGVLLGDGLEKYGGLRRCTASSGDLSGAAEDYEEALVSFPDGLVDQARRDDPVPRNQPLKIARKPEPKKNVWESVFNPGRNMKMRGKIGASMFDRPSEERATSVWDEILKAEAVRNLSFADLDKNGDGYITAPELRAVLGPNARVNELIKEADRNGDGMIDRREFANLLRRL